MTNQLFALMILIPDLAILNIIAPLYSILSMILGIVILFFTNPYFSWLYAAIGSGILFGRLFLSVEYLFKAIIVFLESVSKIFHKSQELAFVYELFLEIDVIYLIPCFAGSILGVTIFLIWAGFLIWRFWTLVDKTLMPILTNSNPVNGNSETENEKDEPTNSGKKEKKKKRISHFFRLALRMQFSFASSTTKKKIAKFLIAFSDAHGFSGKFILKIQGFIFSIYYPQYFVSGDDNSNYQRVTLTQLERKIHKLGFISLLNLLWRKSGFFLFFFFFSLENFVHIFFFFVFQNLKKCQETKI